MYRVSHPARCGVWQYSCNSCSLSAPTVPGEATGPPRDTGARREGGAGRGDRALQRGVLLDQ